MGISHTRRTLSTLSLIFLRYEGEAISDLLIETLDPRYQVPSRSRISKEIDQLLVE